MVKGKAVPRAKKRRKAKFRIAQLKNSKDAVDRLYAATAEYVKEKGGGILVIGGVQISDNGSGRFGVIVNCLGKLPKFAR